MRLHLRLAHCNGKLVWLSSETCSAAADCKHMLTVTDVIDHDSAIPAGTSISGGDVGLLVAQSLYDFRRGRTTRVTEL